MPGTLPSLNLLPVARRELLVLAKRPSSRWLRVGAALATAAISLSVLIPGSAKGALPTEIGGLLFVTLVGLATVISLTAGPLLAADCLSEEKRGGTLGLLFLTSLRGYDIVAGKFVSFGLPALYCLLAIFPMLGISFFLGGVSGGEFTRVVGALIALLFYSLSTALLISAVCRQSRHAIGSSVLVLLVACLGPALLDWQSIKTGNAPAASAIALSPLAGVGFAFDTLHGSNPNAYTTSLSFTLLTGLLWLLLACFWLPHSWQERSPDSTAKASFPARPKQQPTNPLRRRAMLNRNSAGWLATRQRGGAVAIWTPAALFTLTTAWQISQPGMAVAVPGLLISIVILAHGLYKLWVAWEASHSFIADRYNGELELLLCTPLDSRQIWQSHLARLKRRFLGPLALLLATDLWLLVLGLGREGWLDENPEFTLPLIALAVALPLDCYAAAWVGLWQSLTARTATRAMLRTVTFSILLPSGGLLLGSGCLVFVASSAPEAFLWLVASWFIVGAATDIGQCGWTMVRVSDSFREAATRLNR